MARHASYQFKLYHYPAVRSARVKWLLHKLVDDQFEVETVELYESQQYSQSHGGSFAQHDLPGNNVSDKNLLGKNLLGKNG